MNKTPHHRTYRMGVSHATECRAPRRACPLPPRTARRRPLVVALACIVGIAAGRADAQCRYDVTMIQQDCAVATTIGLGLNELGHVVGHFACLGQDEQAFLWTPESGVITLAMPPGTIRSRALAIADDGKIVGWFDLSGDGLDSLGFLIDGEEFINLGTLPGGNFSEALAISNAGQVVGVWGDFVTGDPGLQVFLWEHGVMTDLGPALTPPNNVANGMSDVGRIVGWMGTVPHIDSHAFIWDDGEVLDLGVIPGGMSADALGTNNRGEVVGRGAVQEFPLVFHAVVWSGGEMLDIGTLVGFQESTALAINDRSIVVGGSEDPGLRAVIWQDGVMTDLNELIDPDLNLDVKVARAVSNSGQIAGHAQVQGVDVVAVLLTPIGSSPADLDGDCRVGIVDFLALLASWGPCPDPCPPTCVADIDGDCIVGILDFLTLLMNWTA